jgi:glutathione S-transferase
MGYVRTDIDLENKPDWLKEISPNGRVPVLRVGDKVWLFESGAIARFVDSQAGGRLMPEDPLACAQHDAWMCYGDDMLSIVAGIIYRDESEAAVAQSIGVLADRLRVMDCRFSPHPHFAGPEFGLVDAVMVTLFRSFAVLDSLSDLQITARLSGVQKAWWERVRVRRSVQAAAPRDFDDEYADFIASKNSHAGRVLTRLRRHARG